MTYKDKLIGEMSEEETPLRGFSVCEFIRSMAVVLVCDSVARLQRDEPEAFLGDKKAGGGKGKFVPSIVDVRDVLLSNDILRGTSQFSQLSRFYKWLLEEEAVFDESEIWYGAETLIDKWNEFAEAENNI